MPPPAIRACFRKRRRDSPSSDKKASISSLSTPSAANNSLSTSSSMARNPSYSFSHPIICSLIFSSDPVVKKKKKRPHQPRVKRGPPPPTISAHLHIEPLVWL